MTSKAAAEGRSGAGVAGIAVSSALDAGEQKGDQKGDPGRRDEILDAAFAVLRDKGYQGASTLAIARCAGASKETLYNWFGSKDGLFAALIGRFAGHIHHDLDVVLAEDGVTTERALKVFGGHLLGVLFSEVGLTSHRVAMGEALRNPEFGRMLLEYGRSSVRPRIVALLEQRRAAGELVFDSAETACSSFLGLLLGDLHLRALLGDDVDVGPAVREAQVAHAVRTFLRAFAAQDGLEGHVLPTAPEPAPAVQPETEEEVLPEPEAEAGPKAEVEGRKKGKKKKKGASQFDLF